MFVRDTGGAGPAVLLLHGWGATGDINFFNVYPQLADAYRVVGVDHRGHGRGLRVDSQFSLEDCADDASGLLQALGIERAVVVGYSMGGPIALLLARRHPQRCAGLVLEATALIPPGPARTVPVAEPQRRAGGAPIRIRRRCRAAAVARRRR